MHAQRLAGCPRGSIARTSLERELWRLARRTRPCDERRYDDVERVSHERAIRIDPYKYSSGSVLDALVQLVSRCPANSIRASASLSPRGSLTTTEKGGSLETRHPGRGDGRQAGSVTAPVSAPRPQGTWASAMNAASPGSTSAANAERNRSRSSSRKPPGGVGISGLSSDPEVRSGRCRLRPPSSTVGTTAQPPGADPVLTSVSFPR
jgi:hypothetical protein